MPQHVISGSPPVTVHLRRSGRARRMSLRVSRLDGKVTLTLPAGASEREARAFADSRADWIRQHLSRQPRDTTVAIGTVLPVEGTGRRIVPGGGRHAVLDGATIRVAPDSAGRRVQALLMALARDRLDAAASRHAARIGRPITELALRDTRSRWGSCSERGRLMFSWRLIMAPPEVLDYVAAHEVAHLREMHHGPAFWDLVGELFGPHAAERRWLRDHAGDLHRFRF